VRLLLDTHTLLWALSAPGRLPSRVAELIRDAENAVYVSAASAWEVAIKADLGKLKADWSEIARAVVEVGFQRLDVSFAHALRLRSLPARHRDPFDRMLIAQALEEGLTIATKDRAFSRYAVPTVWD